MTADSSIDGNRIGMGTELVILFQSRHEVTYVSMLILFAA